MEGTHEAAAAPAMDLPSMDLVPAPSAVAPASPSAVAAGASAAPPPPVQYSLYVGKVAEEKADGMSTKRPHSWRGLWNLGKDPIQSRFDYQFYVVPSSYAQPMHCEGVPVANPALPSALAHGTMGTTFFGHYMYKEYSQVAREYVETPYNEPSVRQSSSSSAAKPPLFMTLKIGGQPLATPPTPFVPSPLELWERCAPEALKGTPTADLLAACGQGKNSFLGDITWTGVYHPGTGTLIMTKHWKAAPQLGGQRAKSCGGRKSESEGGAGAATTRGRVAGDELLKDAKRYQDGSNTLDRSQLAKIALRYAEGVEMRLSESAKAMTSVFLAIRNNKVYPRFFVTPVDTTAYPMYPTVIDHPIALNDIQTKLEAGEYGSTAAFYADVELIWDNARKFNPLVDGVQNEVYRDAVYFENEYKKARKSYEQSVERAADKERKKAEEEAARVAAKKEREQAEERRRMRLLSDKQADAALEGIPLDEESGEPRISRPKRPRKPVEEEEAEPDEEEEEAAAVEAAKRRKVGAGAANIAALENTVAELAKSVKMMAQMQAAQMAGGGMGGGGFGMPSMLSQMQGQLASASGVLAGYSAPSKKGGPRKPRGSKMEESGDSYINGDEMDAYLDAEDERVGKGKKGTAKTAGPRKSMTSSRPALADSGSLALTDAEKAKLSEDVASLPAEDTEAVIQMLVDRNLVAPNAEGEVELDMNAIPAPVLRELQRIVAGKLGKPVAAATGKAGKGRPPGSGTYAGGDREQTIAAASRVAAASMDRISALGGGAGAGGFGGFGE
jgi:hypothetical protein